MSGPASARLGGLEGGGSNELDRSQGKIKGEGSMLSRGPDVLLTKRSVVEMVLDRQLNFDQGELDFHDASVTRTVTSAPRVDEQAPHLAAVLLK